MLEGIKVQLEKGIKERIKRKGNGNIGIFQINDIVVLIKRGCDIPYKSDNVELVFAFHYEMIKEIYFIEKGTCYRLTFLNTDNKNPEKIEEMLGLKVLKKPNYDKEVDVRANGKKLEELNILSEEIKGPYLAISKQL